MNNPQWVGVLRHVLQIFFGAAIVLGYFTPKEAGDLSAAILAVAGPVGSLLTLLWMLYSQRQVALLEKASKVPDTLVVTSNPKMEDLTMDPTKPNIVSPLQMEIQRTPL